jgi:hypothetical protein
MTGFRIALAILAVLMIGLLVWAGANSLTPLERGGMHGDVLQQIGPDSPIWGLPMGLFVTLDRLALVAVVAVVIVLAEKSYLSGAIWALPTVLFGAAWAAIWLVLRLPSLGRRLTFPDREEN